MSPVQSSPPVTGAAGVPDIRHAPASAVEAPSGESRHDTPRTPYRRGYRPPSTLRDAVAAAHRTHFGTVVRAALVDHVVVAAATLSVAAAAAAAPVPVTVVVATVAAVIVARQIRALENLVHEGSHYNWSRRAKARNDRWTRVLAALPTASDLREYRQSHLRHHGRFGTIADPDRHRYEELAVEALDRSSAAAFVRGVLERLPAYLAGWWRAGGQGWRHAVAAGYATVVTGLVPALVFGWDGALWAIGTWFVGHAVALPVIRFVAEAGEHRYSDADTVFDATYSNLGFVHRWVFHPHHDGYHTIHHMWPGIPFHALPGLHARLLAEDPHGYGARLRARTAVLDRKYVPERKSDAAGAATD